MKTQNNLETKKSTEELEKSNGKMEDCGTLGSGVESKCIPRKEDCVCICYD